MGNEELSIWMADIYCLIGEKEEAIKWLKSAVRKGFINYTYLKSKDLYLGNIRSDISFKDVLKEIRLKSEPI